MTFCSVFDQLVEGIQWRKTQEGLRAFAIDGTNEREVAWAPQPGSQEAFLRCPVFEVCLEGTRGGGKTDSLLMDFAQHVGMGYGAEWRGMLFRRKYPELADLIAKTKKWFPRIWPDATYNEARSEWKWATGETLLLRFMMRPDDYWSYHGASFPWIGWEELVTWPDLSCYQVMQSCSRSPVVGMPRKYRSTCNPSGRGHNAVKEHFQLPVDPGRVVGPIITDSITKLERVAIHGTLWENKILLTADPAYPSKIKSAARNKSELAAWLEGSWDIVSGGMFDDVWSPAVHVLPNIPWNQVPKGWRLDRSFDWGMSRPFSVGWWAESDGQPVTINCRLIGNVRGDLIRLAEWYGWTGTANEGLGLRARDIGKEIVKTELGWGMTNRFRPGPADGQIFDDYSPGHSTAGDMELEGVRWTRADKGQGSREQGWQQMRSMFIAARPLQDRPREEPGLFICEGCAQFRRTVPVLSRDERKLDDIDSDAEDHIADEVRYRVRAPRREALVKRWK